MISHLLLAGAGIILFLFGMTALSDVMQKLITARMRNYLRLIVEHRFTGSWRGSGQQSSFRAAQQPPYSPWVLPVRGSSVSTIL